MSTVEVREDENDPDVYPPIWNSRQQKTVEIFGREQTFTTVRIKKPVKSKLDDGRPKIPVDFQLQFAS